MASRRTGSKWVKLVSASFLGFVKDGAVELCGMVAIQKEGSEFVELVHFSRIRDGETVERGMKLLQEQMDEALAG